MKPIGKILAMTLVPLTLALGTGCDTTTGAASGAALGGLVGAVADHAHPGTGALIGLGAGAVAGGIIGTLNAHQKAYLQQNSPDTLQTLQHNDQIRQQQQQQAQAQNGQAPAAAATQAPQAAPAAQPTQNGQAPQATPAAAPAGDAPIPLKVTDITAMTAAGIKPDAIIDEIKESKGTYTAAAISAAQQATPPVDATVIACMKNPSA